MLVPWRVLFTLMINKYQQLGRSNPKYIPPKVLNLGGVNPDYFCFGKVTFQGLC